VLELIRAWAPTVPGAIISALNIGEEDSFERVGKGSRSRSNGRAGVDRSRMVLVGVESAQSTAVRLALDPTVISCAGVLACGSPCLLLSALAG